jgi:prepilin-type N-terminal cleavage/methylation domain-containing protein/prepilin-type processing-associated H-X9-DG protein
MKKGFTLIELLVVIAIIAILAAILFPVFARAREKARQTTCTNNQRQIALSISMYAQDHGEVLPDEGIWGVIGADPGILKCPSNGKFTIGYGYNGTLLGKSIGDVASPSDEFVTGDSNASTSTPPSIINLPGQFDARHSNSVIVSYLDGHVGVCKSDNLPATVVSLKSVTMTSANSSTRSLVLTGGDWIYFGTTPSSNNPITFTAPVGAAGDQATTFTFTATAPVVNGTTMRKSNGVSGADWSNHSKFFADMSFNYNLTETSAKTMSLYCGHNVGWADGGTMKLSATLKDANGNDVSTISQLDNRDGSSQSHFFNDATIKFSGMAGCVLTVTLQVNGTAGGATYSMLGGAIVK